MSIILVFIIAVAAYLIGSIPFGWIVVKLISGRDVRFFASGRTGGTNAMRAAGPVAGILTGLLDVSKGLAAGWMTAALAPGDTILKVLAVTVAIIGHNYSFFLIERDAENRLVFRGGAGGATALGGAMSLWLPSALYIFPIIVAIFFFIGYASLTTISISLTAFILFVIRALNGAGPWEHILYGVLSTIIVLWALRPNLKRLAQGTERLTGLRGHLKHRKEKNNNPPGMREGDQSGKRRTIKEFLES